MTAATDAPPAPATTLAARARALGVPWVSAITALVLVAAFGAELAAGVDGWRPQARDLVAIGGNWGPAVGRGGAWRLAIAPLLHLGVLHVAWNLIGLALVGPPLERARGGAVTALALAGGAALGGALHLAVAPYVMSVGASGATFGAAAALAIAALGAELGAARRDARIRLAVFAALNVAAALATADVDPWAHLGGVIAGAAIAVVAGRAPARAVWRLRPLAAAAVIGAATVAMVAATPPSVDEEAARARIVAVEGRFDALVPATIDHPAPALARRLEAEVIPALEEIRGDLRDDARLPADRASSVTALRGYVEARLRGCRAVARFLDTGDPGARAEIEAADRDADRALRGR